MDANEFMAWRKAEGFSQAQAADALGKSRATVNRWETGASQIPDDVAQSVKAWIASTPDQPPPKVVAIAPKTRGFDPIKAGLTACTINPNIPKRDWTANPLQRGWQRVGDRVVHASIPNPIDFEPPPWAGWRGCVTANGRVYDYETGAPMRDHNAVDGGGFTPNSTRPGGGYLKAKHQPSARA